MPELMEHFDNTGFDPAIVTLQWFTCLFAYNFNFDVLVRLWDVYFLKG